MRRHTINIQWLRNVACCYASCNQLPWHRNKLTLKRTLPEPVGLCCWLERRYLRDRALTSISLNQIGNLADGGETGARTVSRTNE
jgi:hypothetical protein